jgi:hypothetical protein
MRYKLCLILSTTEVKAAVYDVLEGEWRYFAQQPLDMAQAVAVEVQQIFGAVEVLQHRIS